MDPFSASSCSSSGGIFLSWLFAGTVKPDIRKTPAAFGGQCGARSFDFLPSLCRLSQPHSDSVVASVHFFPGACVRVVEGKTGNHHRSNPFSHHRKCLLVLGFASLFLNLSGFGASIRLIELIRQMGQKICF